MRVREAFACRRDGASAWCRGVDPGVRGVQSGEPECRIHGANYRADYPRKRRTIDGVRVVVALGPSAPLESPPSEIPARRRDTADVLHAD